MIPGIERLMTRPKRAWKETQIFYLPLMPTEQDEKDVRLIDSKNSLSNLTSDLT
jgi:hypothetical protein